VAVVDALTIPRDMPLNVVVATPVPDAIVTVLAEALSKSIVRFSSFPLPIPRSVRTPSVAEASIPVAPSLRSLII
jgi:hypothetical protein